MLYQLLARVVFALSPIVFALAAWSNPSAAGWASLAVAVPLLVWLQVKGSGDFVQLLKNKKLVQLGLCFAGVNGLTITALALAPVPTVVALSSLGALAGVLIAPLFHEKVSGKDLLTLPLGIIGGILVVSGSPPDIPLIVWPIMLVEVILLAISMHLFAEARVLRREKVSHVILILQIPPLLLLPFTIFLPPPEIASLGYLAIGGILLAIGNTLLYYSFDSLPAHRSLIVKPLSTAMAAFLGVLLLGDPWTFALLVGGILIIISTALIGFSGQRESQ